MQTLPASVLAMLDKQAIHEVLCHYCRALDRCDLELMKKVYWEDALDAHGVFEGNAHEFAAFIIRGIQQWFVVATHAISNVLIELDGDTAYSEAYLFSYCRVEGTREKVEAVFGPEYADREAHGCPRLEPERSIDLAVVGRHIRSVAATGQARPQRCSIRARLKPRRRWHPREPGKQGAVR